MKFEVDVENYLDLTEIKEICKSVIKQKVSEDFERILGNSAYHLVFDAVNEIMDGKAKSIIKEKSLEIIKDLSSYTVFSKASYGERKNSVAYDVMNKTIEENKDIVMKKTIEALNKIDYDEKVENMSYSIGESIIEALKKQ